MVSARLEIAINASQSPTRHLSLLENGRTTSYLDFGWSFIGQVINQWFSFPFKLWENHRNLLVFHAIKQAKLLLPIILLNFETALLFLKPSLKNTCFILDGKRAHYTSLMISLYATYVEYHSGQFFTVLRFFLKRVWAREWRTTTYIFTIHLRKWTFSFSRICGLLWFWWVLS